MNDNNHDNQIVLNPSSITPNIVNQCPATDPNDERCNTTETLIDLGDDSSIPATEQHAGGHQSNQIIHPSSNEPSSLYSNDSMQTSLLSREYDTHPNTRYSPPPPYALYHISNATHPAPYPSQIVHFPQQPTVQYLHHQRLQYPQQESLQYHEEMSDYPQSQRMAYPRRDGNFPPLYEPPSPFERDQCDSCLMIDTMCCCFCVLPILLLISIIFFGSINGF